MGIFYKFLIVFLLILEPLVLSPLKAQSIHEIEKAKVWEVTENFVEALIIGDISTIKSHVAGSLKNQLRTLLNDNKEYSKILRKQYENALYQIGDPIIDEKRALVDLSIKFAEHKMRFFKIKLEKNKGKWMVVEQQESF